MALTVTCGFGEYKPWSGAKDNYERLEREGKLDAFENLLDESYPEGISFGQINDILWFDFDWVCDCLGMTREEEDEEDE